MQLKRQSWRKLVWEIIVGAVALAATVWCVVEFNILLVFGSRLGTYIIRGLRFVWRILYRLVSETIWAFLWRKILRPIYVGLGIEWAFTFAHKIVMLRGWPMIRPYILRCRITIKKTWRWQPWYVRTILSLTGVAMLIILSLGLFLIPLGLSTYGALIGRAQAALGDSFLQRTFKKKERLRRVRLTGRRIVRNRHNWPLIGRYRAARYWLLTRDRRWQARANKWMEEKLENNKNDITVSCDKRSQRG